MTRDELLRAWVAALESGKYEQGRAALRSDNCYCCLGVLCDITDSSRWKLYVDAPGLYRYDFPDSWLQGARLPERLRERVGMTVSQEDSLISANDRGERFPEIAQRIRAMFPDVFPVAA